MSFNNGGQIPAFGNEKTEADMLKNKISILEEDIECTHMGLDALEIPRSSPNGTAYSLIGRITWMQKKHLRDLSEIENEIRSRLQS